MRRGIFTGCRTWQETAKNLLFPPRCILCDEILTPEQIKKGIHPSCENKLYPIQGAVCMHCGRPFGDTKSRNNLIKEDIKNPKFSHLEVENNYEYCRECHRKGYGKQSNIVQGKALYLYQGAIKTSMYRFKYANRREYAKFFAQKTIEQYGDWLKYIQAEVIIPVPMYAKKQRKRGYNQAESFAKELSQKLGISVEPSLIRRVKDTTPQKELSDKERKNNLKNAFQIQKNIVQYNKVLVVDDIYTTGYTAEAVAREIKSQGCCVYMLSICIGKDY